MGGMTNASNKSYIMTLLLHVFITPSLQMQKINAFVLRNRKPEISETGGLILIVLGKLIFCPAILFFKAYVKPYSICVFKMICFYKKL